MGNKKLELRALKLDESDLNSLFLLEVSDGLWSFTTDALDEQRETFGRALNYWVEKNPDSTKADLRPFQPLLCFHSENWNRVLYLNKEASKHRVFFVDLGLSDLIDLESAESHFRIIEPEFWNNRPAQVIMTPQLYEVTPEQMYDLQVSDHRMRMENAEVSSHWDWPIQIVTGKLFSSRTKETGPIERPIPSWVLK